MQNVFHVKTVKMQDFSPCFSAGPRGLLRLEKNQLATHFACFTPAEPLLMGAGCNSNTSLRESKSQLI